MGVGMRWLVAVLIALAAFGAFWLGLAVARVWDTGAQIGVASVPLVIGLAVLGSWAERARKKEHPDAHAPKEQITTSAQASSQGQAIGRVRDSELIIGPGASLQNAVFNFGKEQSPESKPSEGVETRALSSAGRGGAPTGGRSENKESLANVAENLEGLVLRASRTTRYGESQNIEIFDVAIAEQWIVSDPWGRLDLPGAIDEK